MLDGVRGCDGTLFFKVMKSCTAAALARFWRGGKMMIRVGSITSRMI